MTRVSLVMQNWPHPPTSFTSCEEQGGCGTGEVSAPGIGALCVSVCVMQSHYGHLSSAAGEQDGSLNLKDNILIWEHFNVQVRVRSSLQEMNTKEPEEAEREFVIFAFGHSLVFFSWLLILAFSASCYILTFLLLASLTPVLFRRLSFLLGLERTRDVRRRLSDKRQPAEADAWSQTLSCWLWSWTFYSSLCCVDWTMI